MQHPNKKRQEEQENFLKQCTKDEKKYHARLFRLGNAAFIYHSLATSGNNETLKIFFTEWLEGLPANIKADMKRLGFDKCKNMLPFTRYVNERQDIGMDEWMKEHLTEDDYKYYKEQGAKLQKPM